MNKDRLLGLVFSIFAVITAGQFVTHLRHALDEATPQHLGESGFFGIAVLIFAAMAVRAFKRASNPPQ